MFACANEWICTCEVPVRDPKPVIGDPQNAPSPRPVGRRRRPDRPGGGSHARGGTRCCAIGVHPAASALRTWRAGAGDRHRDHDHPPRQASPGLRGRTQRGGGCRPCAARSSVGAVGRHGGHDARSGSQQRRRALESQFLLDDDDLARHCRWAVAGTAGCHRPGVRVDGGLQVGVQRGGYQALRLRMGVVDRRAERRTRCHVDSQPGQPADGRRRSQRNPLAR